MIGCAAIVTLSASLLGAQSLDLKRGQEALAKYQLQDALESLERARQAGPYNWDDHVLLYEQLGIAYAYAGQPEQALASFEMMLALDHLHVLSYTLSPKATFVFERARKQWAQLDVGRIDLSWPRGLFTTDPVPVDIEVASDPKKLFRRAELFVRPKGQPGYRRSEVQLAEVGEYRRVMLPPVEEEPTHDAAYELYLVALDDAGNEVQLVGTADRPREISLSVVPPTPWYQKWWVWASAAGVVAVGAGLATYFALDEPPEKINGTFEVR